MVDGGLVVTDNDQIADLARIAEDPRFSQKNTTTEMLGYNSRLDALQAAVLKVKLQYIDTWNQQRRQVAETYNQLLTGVEGVITPQISEGHVFHQYTVRVLGGKRDQVTTSLVRGWYRHYGLLPGAPG